MVRPVHVCTYMLHALDCDEQLCLVLVLLLN